MIVCFTYWFVPGNTKNDLKSLDLRNYLVISEYFSGAIYRPVPFRTDPYRPVSYFYPKNVIIEINGGYLPGIIKWHKGKPGNKYGGNSFSATLKVAENKGYQLICHTGNMLFIKKEYLNDINLNPKYIIYPELLFDDQSFLEGKKKNIFEEFINLVKKYLN